MNLNATDNDGVVSRRSVIFNLLVHVVTPFGLHDLGKAFTPQAEMKADGQGQ